MRHPIGGSAASGLRGPTSVVLALGFAIAATPAYASDFTPLMLMLVGFIALVFGVVFGIVWFITRRIKRRWLRVLLRATVIAMFWTPVQEGGAGYWWPLAFSWPKLLEPAANLIVVVSLVAVTVVLWGMAMVIGQDRTPGVAAQADKIEAD